VGRAGCDEGRRRGSVGWRKFAWAGQRRTRFRPGGDDVMEGSTVSRGCHHWRDVAASARGVGPVASRAPLRSQGVAVTATMFRVVQGQVGVGIRSGQPRSSRVSCAMASRTSLAHRTVKRGTIGQVDGEEAVGTVLLPRWPPGGRPAPVGTQVTPGTETASFLRYTLDLGREALPEGAARVAVQRQPAADEDK